MPDPMTPARRDALLRMLADWKAGRCTPTEYVRKLGQECATMNVLGYIACSWDGWTLTPAGLAAARAAKGGEG